jgi:hypothetical protein
MKIKSLFALALILTAVGLQLPAAADDRDGSNQNTPTKQGKRYSGKYHYHKLSDGSHIYIGSKGDYWDQKGNYYPDTRENDYEKYYDTSYDYSKGDYYESGAYYQPKKPYRSSSKSYSGKYHYAKTDDGAQIYIGSKGDYWDQKGNYYPDTPENNYEKYYSDRYDYSKGDYYDAGKYYKPK